MQQTGGYGDGVHFHFCQNQRDFERMDEIRLARSALLAGMVLLRKLVGLAHQFEIVVGTVLAHVAQQLAELRYREDVGRDLFAQSSHGDARVGRTSLRQLSASFVRQLPVAYSLAFLIISACERRDWLSDLEWPHVPSGDQRRVRIDWFGTRAFFGIAGARGHAISSAETS